MCFSCKSKTLDTLQLKLSRTVTIELSYKTKQKNNLDHLFKNCPNIGVHFKSDCDNDPNVNPWYALRISCLQLDDNET